MILPFKTYQSSSLVGKALKRLAIPHTRIQYHNQTLGTHAIPKKNSSISKIKYSHKSKRSLDLRNKPQRSSAKPAHRQSNSCSNLDKYLIPNKSKEPDIPEMMMIDEYTRLLEKFDIIRKIGEGSFSWVFEAINIANGAKVAVKVFKNTQRCYTDSLREIEILESLHRAYKDENRSV